MQLCDIVEGEPAIATFIWPWGEQGFCSARGQVLLRQKAKNLKREISFLPLANLEAPPLERSERERLHAKILAAEGELEEVRRRSSKLYEDNRELGQDLTSTRAREKHLQSEVASLKSDIEKSTKERARLSAELGAVTQELRKAQQTQDNGRQAEEIANLRAQLEAANEKIQALEAE